jgi:hypothetical protein
VSSQLLALPGRYTKTTSPNGANHVSRQLDPRYRYLLCYSSHAAQPGLENGIRLWGIFSTYLHSNVVVRSGDKRVRLLLRFLKN